MATIRDTLTNGLAEGIRSIVTSAAGDLSEIDTAANELASRQAVLVEATLKELADSEKQALILAELGQSDNYTKRARPTVVYAGLVFIFLVHVLPPSIAVLTGVPVPAGLKLPTEFWWAWTGVVSVWVLGRSYEKANGTSTMSKLITGS